MRADFHLHSNVSDGKYTPQEVVRLAAAAGVRVMALTDHDTVAGIVPAQAAARELSIRFVPGVELGTDIPFPEVHILGFFVDPGRSEFQVGLEQQRNSRVARAQKMLEKLEGMGVHLSWEQVRTLAAGESVGRPHIAQAIVENGYVPTLGEAFATYIGRESPAYVKREKLTPESAVALICRGNGLAVLAHPAEIQQIDELLPRLKAAGLVGVEAYYNNYPPHVVNSILATASRHELLPLGGSDYHGVGGNDTPIGGLDIPTQVVENFLALSEERDRFCSTTG
ncbi:MAG: PHP domain-containing protein [Dehalococcoidia bacterium]|nr:PHP domain-containing protein [Dehalococcoidia bacterium]MDP7469829.1 PHP domain-containing protein [Dehalococcoidia bacterium]